MDPIVIMDPSAYETPPTTVAITALSLFFMFDMFIAGVLLGAYRYRAGSVSAFITCGLCLGLLIYANIHNDHEREKGAPVVDDDAVTAAISEQFVIDKIAPIDDVSPTSICTEASTKSPLYTGVTDGQEIRFRVGFSDCDDPTTVQIIVTETPGQAISATDLERG